MNKIGVISVIAIAVIVVFVLAAVAVTVEGATGKTKVTPAKKNVKLVSQSTKQAKTASSPAPAAACTETDGGSDFNVQGTCTGTNGAFTDYCRADGALVEWGCGGVNTTAADQCGTTDHSCSAGKSCQNGACA